ncbi:hypothetical protein [Amycolatopsis orientalis]|uniref:hypothetical protein n=1 Tax=Amycolatopsis orientalis TaxID=31958 RepID=UPI00056686F4|nr:hypothetical protein [Amycolatopsis orientalis]
MSTVPDADTTPAPDRIVAVEPEEGRPPRGDRWFALSLSGRRGTRLLVAFVCLAVCVAIIVFARSRIYLALPAVVAVFAAARLWLLARIAFRAPKRVRERLLDLPFRKVLVDDDMLRATKCALYLRLANDQWFRVGRPRASGLIASRGYVWLTGPEPAGRAGLVVPGSVTTAVLRVRTLPSSALPVPPRVPDPTHNGQLRQIVQLYRPRRTAAAVIRLALAAWLAATYAPLLLRTYRQSDELLGLATFLALYLAAALVWTSAVSLHHWRIRAPRAALATTWTPLRIVSDSMRSGGNHGKLTCRVTSPEGTRTASIAGLPFVAAARTTGVVWAAGQPKKGTVLIGLPGYPILGIAKLGRIEHR